MAEKPTYEELEQRAKELEEEAVKRKIAEERIEHLNLVLRAVRNVNQLITKEKDKDLLLQGACDNLTETRGYYNAWIILLDESGSPVTTAATGLGKDFLSLLERLKHGEFTNCCRDALPQSKVIVIRNPPLACADCPLSSMYNGRVAMTVRLEYEGKVYGLLSASILADFSSDKEAQSFFKEVAEDIAFALYNMELEEERKRMEDELKKKTHDLGERVKELNCLYGISELIEKPGTKLEEIIQGIVELIPRSWQYPGITCSRIIFESEEYRTENYRGTDWKQSSDIFVHGEQVGAAEVYYLEEKPEIDEGPFLKEERSLINAIAERLGRITERKRAGEDLKVSEERFRTIYQNAPILMNSFDEGGRCILWNKECEKTFGWTMEEITSYDNPLSLFYPDQKVQKQVIETVISKPEGVYREWHSRTKDGNELFVLWANFRILDGTIINIGYDITESKLLEDQLIRSERLAASGQLAVSIAHEINSPLQGITSILNSIERNYKQDEKLLEKLNLLKSGFISIRNTVKKLLDLNRPGKERKQSMNINSVIEDTVDLLKSHLIKNKVKISLNLSSKLPSITAIPQQLGQVFMNLINNAVEATAGTSKSKDGWKTRESTGREITINSNLRKDNIIIKVADTGPGISKESMEHIFDPFYTSKREMGMGIGLSLCHGIIEDHSGSIAAKNFPEGGAIFTITLPIRQTVRR